MSPGRPGVTGTTYSRDEVLPEYIIPMYSPTSRGMEYIVPRDFILQGKYTSPRAYVLPPMQGGGVHGP